MKNLKRLIQLLLLCFLFSSWPSWSATHSDHGHKDYTECLYETGTGNLNVDQVLCVEKGCECYTKVFKNQIDGLTAERTEEVQDKMRDVYSQVASSILTDLTDMNTIYEQNGASLLGTDSLIKNACSFDSLRDNLSCKSDVAKEIVTNIQKEFKEKSGYSYGEEKGVAKETPYQCLTQSEVRGVSLLKERQKGMNSFVKKIKNLPANIVKEMLQAENPLQYLKEHDGRKQSLVLRSLSDLPIVRNLFQSQNGFKNLMSEIENGKINQENLTHELTHNKSLKKELNLIISSKCNQIFESIDKLACKKIAHPFVASKEFNYSAFGYRETEPESDLETHLFYCQGKICLEGKNCTPKESASLDSNDLLGSLLGKESIAELSTKGKASDGGDNINRRICALLVCGDKAHGGDLFKNQVDNIKATCSPILSPKRTPMEAYSLLDCPNSDICNMPEMADFKAYLEYFKTNMVVETQTMMTPADGLTLEADSPMVEKTVTVVSKKKSPFLNNFMGEVGQDLEAFFKKPEPKTELAKKIEEKAAVATNTQDAVNVSTSKGKVFRTPQGNQNWSNFRKKSSVISNTTAFTPTEIGNIRVGGVTGITEREKEYKKTADDAINTASKSIKAANELQEELKNARALNQNFQQEDTQPQREISSITSSVSVDTGGGVTGNVPQVNSETLNRNREMYTGAPYTEADIPTEKTSISDTNNKATTNKADKKSEQSTLPVIPGFEISRSNLKKLNESLIEEFKIESNDAFIIKVSIGVGKKKKIIPVMVENVPYKGKLILRPIKEAHNKEVFSEVLASPLFENYRTILAIREERKKFFNDVLPNIKRI